MLKKIKQCDLSPGLGFESTIMIQPDLEIIHQNIDGFDIQFKRKLSYEVSLDHDLEALVKDRKNKASKAMREKMGEAKWLIEQLVKEMKLFKM